jgi:hypothetical protein
MHVNNNNNENNTQKAPRFMHVNVHFISSLLYFGFDHDFFDHIIIINIVIIYFQMCFYGERAKKTHICTCVALSFIYCCKHIIKRFAINVNRYIKII